MRARARGRVRERGQACQVSSNHSKFFSLYNREGKPLCFQLFPKASQLCGGIGTAEAIETVTTHTKIGNIPKPQQYELIIPNCCIYREIYIIQPLPVILLKKSFEM